jgi:hypothetical protein
LFKISDFENVFQKEKKENENKQYLLLGRVGAAHGHRFQAGGTFAPA